MRLALFEMKPLKAPGADGIHAMVYQQKWGVVGKSIVEMVKRLFYEGVVEPFINKTLITLVPKTERPESFKEFRPISLCTVLYKIITKVVANRLKPLMPEITLPNQSSFVAGRHITDNIIVAKEVFHSMRRKKGKKGYEVARAKRRGRANSSFGIE